MKVYVCLEEDDFDEYTVRHVFFYREDADKWVSEEQYYSRKYMEMKIE